MHGKDTDWLSVGRQKRFLGCLGRAVMARLSRRDFEVAVNTELIRVVDRDLS